MSSLPADSGDDLSKASFRDPAGRLLKQGERLFRLVRNDAVADLNAFLSTTAATGLQEASKLVRTWKVVDADVDELAAAAEALSPSDIGAVLEHDVVPFRSMPYEWPPEMLYAAGLLTLDISERLLEETLELKDATPYNVLFRACAPVFVDVLSVQPIAGTSGVWIPYAQFVRTFVLPLLLNRDVRLPLSSSLMSRRDGVEPDDAYHFYGWGRRILPPHLTLISIPKWLRTRGQSAVIPAQPEGVPADWQKQRMVAVRRSVYRHLRRALRSVEPRALQQSIWTGYSAVTSYSPEASRAKRAFVKDVLEECGPKTVLDIGCNTGDFSLIAAKAGADVVAVDSDPAVVSQVWRQACAERASVLPLVVDMARPTPATGWNNQECPSFLDRARQRFDAVLMLALIHHLIVTERVPLSRIVDLAADVTRDLAIIEFVGPEDPMFRQIERGRHDFATLTVNDFEAACRRRFETIRVLHLPGSQRWLYALRRTR